jgi:hypothetical protein
MPAVRNAAQRLIYEGKTVVARSPRIAVPLGRIRGRGEPIGPQSDIVIEGYPRSANSFAVHAFRVAQGHRVVVAHHLHAPAHLIAAVRAGVPALALIRQPEDAVLEFVISKQYLSIRQALRGYVRFYAALIPYRDRLVIGPFEEVTTDFGAVIARVNLMCGTQFHEFEHTEDNVRASFEAIDADWATRLPPGVMFERKVGRPSAVRERIKQELLQSYRSDELAGLRRRADVLRETLVSTS